MDPYVFKPIFNHFTYPSYGISLLMIFICHSLQTFLMTMQDHAPTVGVRMVLLVCPIHTVFKTSLLSSGTNRSMGFPFISQIFGDSLLNDWTVISWRNVCLVSRTLRETMESPSKRPIFILTILPLTRTWNIFTSTPSGSSLTRPLSRRMQSAVGMFRNTHSSTQTSSSMSPCKFCWSK